MEFKIKWIDGNYDGIDDEDIANGYKEYRTKVEHDNGSVFFAFVGGVDGDGVEASVWRCGQLGMTTKEFTSFKGSKRWATNYLKKRLTRGF